MYFIILSPLDKLNIDYNGFLYWAAYQKNKLLLLVEDAQQEQSLIIIDLTKNTFAVGDKGSETLGAFSKPVGVYWKPIYNLLEHE